MRVTLLRGELVTVQVFQQRRETVFGDTGKFNLLDLIDEKETFCYSLGCTFVFVILHSQKITGSINTPY